jgi:hypothetical protein
VTEDMKIKTMHYQRTKLASQKNPTNQLKEEAFFLTKMFLHFLTINQVSQFMRNQKQFLQKVKTYQIRPNLFSFQTTIE